MVTYGGAFSNHILAVAAAANLFGFESKGIIRGEELNGESSKTLKRATEFGMEFEFITRANYRNKPLIGVNANDFVIPEGGSNDLALLGMAEMVDEIMLQANFDFICMAVGTGGTLAGCLTNLNFKGQFIGIPVLKSAEFLYQDIAKLLRRDFPVNAQLFLNYHFGGYGKTTPELIDFMLNTEREVGFFIGSSVYGETVLWGL